MRAPDGVHRVASIGLLVYDDMQALDLAGPLDVFGAANALSNSTSPYQLHIIGLSADAVRAENGLVVLLASSVRTGKRIR